MILYKLTRRFLVTFPPRSVKHTLFRLPIQSSSPSFFAVSFHNSEHAKTFLSEQHLNHTQRANQPTN